MNSMVDSICKELMLRKNYIDGKIQSIYFGGGTPSILDTHCIEKILAAIYANFGVSYNVEVTLEANPDDIAVDNLTHWKSIGVNRFSLGVQSFIDEDLQWMNRAHNAKQSINSIKMIQDAGFDNFSIDLIYGTPTLTSQQWEENVQTAINLDIPHLSCYALTVEDKTALDILIKKHKKEAPNLDTQAQQFELLMQWLRDAGYEHYEVSNFAKKGFRSKHNSSYWQGKKYLGVGPAAHSYNGHNRQWNIANNTKYINNLQNNIIPFEIEELTPDQRYNEYIMTSLRTIEGISLQYIHHTFGENSKQEILSKSIGLLHSGKMIHSGNYLRLTDQGLLLADGISVDLFR